MSNLAMLDLFPDLCVWKKNINLQFVDMNETAAHIFGFDGRESALGKTDFDIPSKLSNYATTFRENDFNVIKHGKPLKFLEIQPCVNDEWKILHVVKNPYYENNSIAGVIGYAVDITKSYIKLEKFLIDHDSQNSVSQTHIDVSTLTPRESECLFFLLRKCTAKEIANLLKLSHRTIENYIEDLKLKFFCKTKIELIQRAKELGYFNIIPPSLIQKQLSIIVE